MTTDKNVLNDPDIENFLKADPADKYDMTLDDALQPKLEAYLGAEAYRELRAIAADTLKTKKGHLAFAAPPNMIFVPGVMGSLLSSRMSGVWWVDARARDYINELRLAPDGAGDIKPEYGITPFNVDITYMPFLAAVDRREDFNFELFPYDWRKPLSASADALRDKLNATFDKNGKKPVHLVAHSMGGLMVRAMLAAAERAGQGDEVWSKIDRIVFIGTPHYGSPAIAGYLKNHLWGFELLALLGLFLDRATFRSLWGVLSMLPAPRGIYPGTHPADKNPWAGGNPNDPYSHPCANFDMYDAEAWKLDDLTDADKAALQKVLDAAKQFHQEIYDSHQQLKQERRDRMAVIAGVGQKTLFRLAYNTGFWGVWKEMHKEMDRIEGDPHRDGDGRVTVASAALEKIGQIRYVKGIHGELPMIRAVYEDIFRWLKNDPNDPMQLPSTPKGALKGHLGSSGAQSVAPHLTRAVKADSLASSIDDPGLWKLALDQEQFDELKKLLDAEQLPDFNKIRLL
jgi:pimeloyl-ACP methyl ester carboxylesterase